MLFIELGQFDRECSFAVLPPDDPNEDHNGDDGQERTNNEAAKTKRGEEVRPGRVRVAAHSVSLPDPRSKIDAPFAPERARRASKYSRKRGTGAPVPLYCPGYERRPFELRSLSMTFCDGRTSGLHRRADGRTSVVG